MVKGSKGSRGAFTLIELLVVIAIIAVLASILFPVFGRARENARKAACLSNLKQIYLAIKMYASDYDEYPPAGPVSGNTDYGWMLRLAPYVSGAADRSALSDVANSPDRVDRKIAIFQCPNNMELIKSTSTYCTYGANPWVMIWGAWGKFAGSSSSRMPAQVTAESFNFADPGAGKNSVEATDRTILVYDSFSPLWNNSNHFNLGRVFEWTVADRYAKFNPHLDGLNFLFGAGNIEWHQTGWEFPTYAGIWGLYTGIWGD